MELKFFDSKDGEKTVSQRNFSEITTTAALGSTLNMGPLGFGTAAFINSLGRDTQKSWAQGKSKDEGLQDGLRSAAINGTATTVSTAFASFALKKLSSWLSSKASQTATYYPLANYGQADSNYALALALPNQIGIPNAQLISPSELSYALAIASQNGLALPKQVSSSPRLSISNSFKPIFQNITYANDSKSSESLVKIKKFGAMEDEAIDLLLTRFREEGWMPYISEDRVRSLAKETKWYSKEEWENLPDVKRELEKNPDVKLMGGYHTGTDSIVLPEYARVRDVTHEVHHGLGDFFIDDGNGNNAARGMMEAMNDFGANGLIPGEEAGDRALFNKQIFSVLRTKMMDKGYVDPQIKFYLKDSIGLYNDYGKFLGEDPLNFILQFNASDGLRWSYASREGYI